MPRTLYGLIAVATLVLAGPLFAQNATPVPPAVSPSEQQVQQLRFLQGAVNALQAQRNEAEDRVAQANATLAGLQQDLQQAQAKIKGLEDELHKATKAAPVPAPNVQTGPAQPVEEPTK